MILRRRLAVVFGFIIVLCAVAAIAWSVLGANRVGSTASTIDLSPSVVVIPTGASAEQIAKILQSAGVISSSKTFLMEVRARGLETRLRPGTYEFTHDEPLESVMNKLVKGLQAGPGKITIPEGLSIDQVSKRLTEQKVADGEEYERLARTPALFKLPTLGGQQLDVQDLEGLLYPSTYYLPPEKKEEALIREQLEAFATATVSLPWQKSSQLGLSPYEILIVASMIEKETALPSERPLVASVIYNRMKKDMRLDIDATVRFALKKWTGALTKSDLAFDSPYNTRKYKGLPPGPIASPGLEALRAALEPATTDYLYYVLTPNNGRHFFTSSYEEFLEQAKNAPSQDEGP